MQDDVSPAMSTACRALQLETTTPADIKQRGASGRTETLPLAHNMLEYLEIYQYTLPKKKDLLQDERCNTLQQKKAQGGVKEVSQDEVRNRRSWPR